MVKNLLLLLASALALPAVAGIDNNGSNVVDSGNLRTTFEVLNGIEGYVFIEQGQSRDLSQTFSRSDLVMGENGQVELMDMAYTLYPGGEKFVKIEGGQGADAKGIITGLEYGETILTITEGDGTTHDFIVFVCPKVNIVMADGVSYSHQKIYNQKMKVDFTRSQNYAISSVWAEYDGKSYDITDLIDRRTGHYESESKILSDVTYTVIMEENDHPDEIISNSPFRLYVNGNTMLLKDSDPDNRVPESELDNWLFSVITLRGRTVYSKYGKDCVTPGQTYHDLDLFLSSGVYYVRMQSPEGEEYNYKIIIRG